MKILIVQGKEVFVDDDVYQWAKHFNWSLGNKGHVMARKNKGQVWLHRVVMDTPDDMLCDHIDRNPLNNQRENLRNCTVAQNCFNRELARPNSFGYRGVSMDKRNKERPYRAMIQCEGKRKHIGLYRTPEEAAMAYDKMARELHGEFAVLNFPSMPSPLLKGFV